MKDTNETPSFFENSRTIKGLYNGLPYEGPPLQLKDDDAPKLKPTLKGTCMARVFHMNQAAEEQEYNRIIQLMADGRAMQSIQDIRYNKTTQSFDIFLRWLEFKYVGPEEIQDEQAG